MNYPRVATLKNYDEFQNYLRTLGIVLPCDETMESGPEAPLARAYPREGGAIGNRFCILPMEGWDGTEDGLPSELTRRRWRQFGSSGAKLIWGGEAVAVRHDGRANPHQLLLNDHTLNSITSLRLELIAEHQRFFGNVDDLFLGLQLTHSGRFARPRDKKHLEPRILYRHPILDERAGIHNDHAILSDGAIARLIEDFVNAAKLALKAGFAFVDIKHCHGYLGHEFLSAVDRPGRFGGSFENRTRFLRDIVAGIRAEAPGLEIGVRVSIFDFVPFTPGPNGVGVPVDCPGYPYAFGGDGTGLGIDDKEPFFFCQLLEDLGIGLLCTTAGSPYYNPHIQRPAAFPPSDGYQPPEDPLVGVARQIDATARLKARFPQLTIVGSGYSYLQEWLPNVGQAVVRAGGVDFVGLGRMVLSYHDLPADVLSGRTLARKRLCRTFSDCTTAPRNGLVSGCYPLDPHYKALPEREILNTMKERMANS